MDDPISTCGEEFVLYSCPYLILGFWGGLIFGEYTKRCGWLVVIAGLGCSYGRVGCGFVVEVAVVSEK